MLISPSLSRERRDSFKRGVWVDPPYLNHIPTIQLFGLYEAAVTGLVVSVVLCFGEPFVSALVLSSAKYVNASCDPALTSAADTDNICTVNLLGLGEVLYTSVFPLALGMSSALQLIITPFLAALADLGLRNTLLSLFTLVGCAATSVMCLATPRNRAWELAVFGTVLATFAGSVCVVLCNSFLPQIASAANTDRVSAWAHTVGFTSGIFVIVVDIAVMLLFRQHSPGSGAADLASERAALFVAAVWWFAGSLPALVGLPKPHHHFLAPDLLTPSPFVSATPFDLTHRPASSTELHPLASSTHPTPQTPVEMELSTDHIAPAPAIVMTALPFSNALQLTDPSQPQTHEEYSSHHFHSPSDTPQEYRYDVLDSPTPPLPTPASSPTSPLGGHGKTRSNPHNSSPSNVVPAMIYIASPAHAPSPNIPALNTTPMAVREHHNTRCADTLEAPQEGCVWYSRIGWLYLGCRKLGDGVTLVTASPHLCLFLATNTLYSGGIWGYLYVLPLFASRELGMSDAAIGIGLLLFLIFGAMGCYLFLYLAEKRTTKLSIAVSLLVMVFSSIVTLVSLRTALELYVHVCVLAIAIGGCSSMSRSLLSRMAPRGAEGVCFALFQISSNGTAWFGVLALEFAYRSDVPIPLAIATLSVFFVSGLCVLYFVNENAAGFAAKSLHTHFVHDLLQTRPDLLDLTLESQSVGEMVMDSSMLDRLSSRNIYEAGASSSEMSC